MTHVRSTTHGPFHPDQIRSGDPYELSQGHAIYCVPVGGDGARRTGHAFEILDSDPLVESAGVDPGFDLGDQTMRAPDVAVGVPDAPGWVRGAPPLAVEYVGRGQDEEDLEVKIAQLLAAGTKWIWVVYLKGPKRVEVHTSGREPLKLGLDGVLEAPGILKNPVPVIALFDREAAHELTLRNLLQRQGFDGLEQALGQSREQGLQAGFEEGVQEGLHEGLQKGLQQGLQSGQRMLLERLLTARFGPLDEPTRERLATLGGEACMQAAERLLTADDIEHVLGG